MKKVIIIGCPGAGKSYFAKKLHRMTGIPLYHLDMIWHKPDKTHISRAEFDETLKRLFQEESWIMDGDFSRTMEMRMQACDTIILFDLPYEICMQGIREREGTKRDDMPWEVAETDDMLLNEVRNYIPEQLPKVYELLDKYKNKKEIIIFRAREEAEKWLMKRKHMLYLECNAGISGDMTVAALLDLGADEKVLRQVLDSMPLSGFEIEISRVKKAGLDVCDFHVKLDEEHENHDHDMEYLHGHEHRHGTDGSDHSHGHSHNSDGHTHTHEHSHHAHGHSHAHRGLPEIQTIIRSADMSERAKTTALHIFDILARAEAKAHGVSIDEVHFHEVGAVDSIVDIVATAVCLDDLDVTEVIVPCLCEGQGTVRCQHGILPIPVPAVANIVQMNGLCLRLTEVHGELVTPTGAAIAAAVKTKEKLPDSFTVQRVGMGGGKRNYERPSILRAMLIQEETVQGGDGIYKLETNIDDCTGEMLGYVMERLFENGAADVNYTPVFMKKNRPAYLLTVLCDEESVSRLEHIIFMETTTIGIRKIKMERTVLKRELETVSLPEGDIKVKTCTLPDGTIRRYPEYETVAGLARETGRSMQEILASARNHEPEQK